MQLAQLFYLPNNYVPTTFDEAAGQQFIRRLQTVEGDVFIPYHGYYATLAGKPMHAHWMALTDLLGEAYVDEKESASAEVEAVQQALDREVREAVQRQRFDAIVLDTDYEYWVEMMAPHYRYDGPAFEESEGFWTLVGWRTRPEDIYVPRSKISSPSEP
jgi:hypothetical protein